MDALDTLVPQFRRAVERWPDAPTLTKHYQALQESYYGTAYGLIGTIKSFIECACLTILGESGKAMPSADPSTTDLLVEALRCLGLENTRGASKVSKLLSAHNRLADTLSEVRNEGDPVVHGRDGFLDTLTANERRVFLITADTILALLLSAHDGTEPDLQYTREPYERFVHLHQRIDRSAAIESIVEDSEDSQTLVVTVRTNGLADGVKLRVEPSRLLYAVDRTAYVELLASASVLQKPTQPLGTEVPITEDITELRRAPEPPPASGEAIQSYEGVLSPLKGALDQYLASLDLKSNAALAGANLRDSLLAAADPHVGLDWQDREPLQAAIKVALRRTLLQFGIEREKAEWAANHLLTWLKIQAVGLITSASS
jgi:hypothetical protein